MAEQIQFSRYVTELIAKYNQPMTYHDREKLADDAGITTDTDTMNYYYCIGGAYLFSCDVNTVIWDSFVGFPAPDMIAEQLFKDNTDLPYELAYRYADSLVTYNDNEEYDKAWAVLNEALSYVRSNFI